MTRRLNAAETYATPEPNTGCWLWAGPYDRFGYGRYSNTPAHRAMWAATNGPPGSWHVLHKCDNRACVNPDHLFLGTNKDNVEDRKKKGRRCSWPGEGNSRARLTDDDVREIKSRRLKNREYAAKYGVSESTIAMITSGRNWVHIAADQMCASQAKDIAE